MPTVIFTAAAQPIAVRYVSGLKLNTRFVRDYLQTGWWPRYRDRTWARTPNWNKVKRKTTDDTFVIKSLGYTDVQRVRYFSQVTVSHDTYNNGCYLTNQYFGAALLGTASLSSLTMLNLVNATKQKAASKVGDHTVNLGVAAGEAHKTFEMFSGAVKSLASAYGNVRKGRFAQAAKDLGIAMPKRVGKKRNFSDNWLEYRYGWRLLVMDLDGAVRHLAQTMIDHPPIARTKASNKEMSSSTSSGYVSGSNAQHINLWFDYTMLEENFWEVSVVYKYSVPNSALSQLNQLGLTNLQLVAWELVPFSFVIDKVINIGEVLTNMTAFYGKQFLDGCYTMSHTVRRTCYSQKASTGTVHNEFIMKIDGTSWCMLEERSFKRVVLTDFEAGMPSVGWNFNKQNALDALAIARQLRGR